jgi:hypothetical protein
MRFYHQGKSKEEFQADFKRPVEDQGDAGREPAGGSRRGW